MKQKLLSTCLIMIMAFSLIACGEKQVDVKTTMKTVFDKTSEFKAGTITMEAKINIDGSYKESNELVSMLDGMIIKSETILESMQPLKAQMFLTYKTGEEGNYQKVTDVIIDDTVEYINVRDIRQFISGIPSLAAFSSYLPADAEYMELNLKEIQQLGGVDFGSADASTFNSLNNQAMAYQVQMLILQHFIEITADIEPTPVTAEEQSFTISINKDNYNGIIDAILESDMKQLKADLIAAGNSFMNGTVLSKEIEAVIDQSVISLKSGVVDLRQQLTEMEQDFDITMQYGIGKRDNAEGIIAKMDFNLSDDSKNKVDISIDMFALNEMGSNKKVVIPENAVSFVDFISGLY